MKIVRLSKDDVSEIKKFLCTCEFVPIQQTLIWAEFQKSVGVDSVRIGVRNEMNDLITFVQIFVKKLPLGMSWLQIPRAPLFQFAADSQQLIEVSNLVLTEVRKIAKERGAIFARFDFQKDMKLQAKSYELEFAKEENFPLATIRIDLEKTEEEILAAMKPKGRYNIRVAQKHGVKIQEIKEVGEFYELLQKTASRDGFFSHSQKYYEKFLEVLKENAILLLAQKDGKTLGGVILTFMGDTCTYYFGASSYEFRNLMSPYLLQFEAIKIAKRRGCKFYDFLGIAPEDSLHHRLAGVSDFKKKFRGEIIEYPQPKVLILKPLLFKFFKFVKKLRG